MRFPSPCGVCGLKLAKVNRVQIADEPVSVPLRGLWFEIQQDAAEQ